MFTPQVQEFTRCQTVTWITYRTQKQTITLQQITLNFVTVQAQTHSLTHTLSLSSLSVIARERVCDVYKSEYLHSFGVFFPLVAGVHAQYAAQGLYNMYNMCRAVGDECIVGFVPLTEQL